MQNGSKLNDLQPTSIFPICLYWSMFLRLTLQHHIPSVVYPFVINLGCIHEGLVSGMLLVLAQRLLLHIS